MGGDGNAVATLMFVNYFMASPVTLKSAIFWCMTG